MTNSHLEWTTEDSIAASKEGWNVFQVDRQYCDIQKADESDIFVEDAHAIAHVYYMASAGSELHRKALALSCLSPNVCPEPVPMRRVKQ